MNKEKQLVGFYDLSRPVRIGIIVSYLILIGWLLTFVIAFIIGFLGL